jgi:hypothetical protein
MVKILAAVVATLVGLRIAAGLVAAFLLAMLFWG